MNEGQNEPGAGVQILVVDDEEDVASYMVAVLQDHGLAATAVHNVKGALEAIRTRTPDLILLDVMMPGHSGLSLYRQIRGNPGTAEVPVLFVSACTQMSDVLDTDAMTGHEPAGFIEKPIVIDDFLRRVRDALPQVAKGVGRG